MKITFEIPDDAAMEFYSAAVENGMTMPIEVLFEAITVGVLMESEQTPLIEAWAQSRAEEISDKYPFKEDE